MSTRAHIRIVEGEDTISLYRHCDGMPDTCAEDLKTVAVKNNWSDIEYLTADIIRIDPNNRVPTFVPAVSVHGDEEYFYVVDLDKKEIRFGNSFGNEDSRY
jgi:hypothetical protein